jgi:hypothetical protein
LKPEDNKEKDVRMRTSDWRLATRAVLCAFFLALPGGIFGEAFGDFGDGTSPPATPSNGEGAGSSGQQTGKKTTGTGAGDNSSQAFGFGDFNSGGEANDAHTWTVGQNTKIGGVNLGIGGEFEFQFMFYPADLAKQGNFDNIWRPGLLTSKLNFDAKSKIGEVHIGLKFDVGGFDPALRGEAAAMNDPVHVIDFDEIYAKAFFGDFELDVGKMKITWGRADSMGPEDIINPYDFSDMTHLDDMLKLKYANILVHGAYRFGQASKAEIVFSPVFIPWRYATKGRWLPAQASDLIGELTQYMHEGDVKKYAKSKLDAVSLNSIAPDMTSLSNFQIGARYTTTIAQVADIGVQYYYGYKYIPAYDKAKFGAITGALGSAADNAAVDTAVAGLNQAANLIVYNRFHQIAVDWAQVLWGFNCRVELAANITNDLRGTDPACYNPELAWSLGFDRDLFWGINLNLQFNTTARLLPPNGGPYDVEIDQNTGKPKPVTNTRMTAVIMKNFLRDALQTRFIAIWDIEGRGCLIMPQVTWVKDELTLYARGGIFAGAPTEDLGEFGFSSATHNNNTFVTLGLKYNF